MSARTSHAVVLAMAYLRRTGCKPAVAAARYKCDETSITRALRKAGLPVAKRGRPRKAPAP